jgi:hypothetical protein
MMEKSKYPVILWIKMGVREIGWVGMYWIDLAQDRDQ